jgi:uncharacterized membrane protein
MKYPIMSTLTKTKIAALLATVIFATLLVFQVLLAAGVPLGRAAYGGHRNTLSSELRTMSMISALISLGAICTV